jgi:hypothetical protein
MKPGLHGAVQGLRDMAAAGQWWRSAGVRVLAARVGYGLPDLAQKEHGGNAVLIEAQERAVMMCRGIDVKVRRRVAGGARGGGSCRSSPCSWTPRIDAWSACEGATAVRLARGSPAVRNRAAD